MIIFVFAQMNATHCIGEQDKILDRQNYFRFALPATSCTIRAKQSTTTEIFITFMTEINMNKENDMIYPREAYAIVGAAIEVQNEFGCGFAELVYHEALNIELNLRNIPYETEKLITITYKGHQLERTYKADLVCYDNIVVELKAVDKLKTEHTSQLLNYLKATNLPLGILINFGEKPLKFKMVPNYITQKN